MTAWPNPNACCSRNAFEAGAHVPTCENWTGYRAASPEERGGGAPFTDEQYLAEAAGREARQTAWPQLHRDRPAAPSEPAPLDVRPQVAAFAQLMEKVLRDNDHKGGWEECRPDWLLMRLKQEVSELDSAMRKGTVPHTGVDDRTSDVPADPAREAADVANFAMMIADVLGRLQSTPTPTEEPT